MGPTRPAEDAASGTLDMPAGTTGGTALVASVAGTVVRQGGAVRFEQSTTPSFRDLDRTARSGRQSATNPALPGATWTITLTRQ